jgi:SAM-dependent methyltransferase
MKGRESGMPEEMAWEGFFDAKGAVGRLLGAGPSPLRDLVEFGCGYGTFTIPAARLTTGLVTALDIEPEMVACVQRKAQSLGMGHVRAEVRDFVAAGTGLEDGSQSHAMVYNLLHLEAPLDLLQEAARVLAPGGALSVIHWRSDIPTPRGPSLAIRPTPVQCADWLAQAGFQEIRQVDLQELCPYHYGLTAFR